MTAFLHLTLVCPSVCVSSLNCTIHVLILVFMFACSFLNKQFDSIVLSYFPQRVSCFCTHEKSPRAVKRVTWVNLPVSQKNRLLGDITLLYLVAH